VSREACVSLCVRLGSSGVHPAVDLDHEFGPGGEEVHDVAEERSLPPEPVPGGVLTEYRPRGSFRGCRGGTEALGTLELPIGHPVTVAHS
jgi:hypothetical protein